MLKVFSFGLICLSLLACQSMKNSPNRVPAQDKGNGEVGSVSIEDRMNTIQALLSRVDLRYRLMNVVDKVKFQPVRQAAWALYSDARHQVIGQVVDANNNPVLYPACNSYIETISESNSYSSAIHIERAKVNSNDAVLISKLDGMAKRLGNKSSSAEEDWQKCILHEYPEGYNLGKSLPKESPSMDNIQKIEDYLNRH